MFMVLVFVLGGFLGFLSFGGSLLWGFFDFDFWFCFLFLFSFSFCGFGCCRILYSTSLSSYVQPDDGHYGRNM